MSDHTMQRFKNFGANMTLPDLLTGAQSGSDPLPSYLLDQLIFSSFNINIWRQSVKWA